MFQSMSVERWKKKSQQNMERKRKWYVMHIRQQKKINVGVNRFVLKREVFMEKI